jgi:predicted transcriptional regulator
MSGKTISAYTNEQTANKLSEIAKRESRKKAQLAGMAIELFVSLPPAAIDAWLRVVANGEPDIMAQVKDKIARTLLDARYQITHRQLIEEIESEYLEPLETEDDFITAAIAITNDE